MKLSFATSNTLKLGQNKEPLTTGFESFRLTNRKNVEKSVLKIRFDLDIWYNFSITSSKSSPFFSSISEESENDSDEGSGRRGSLAPPSGRFGGGGAPWARATNNVKKPQRQICGLCRKALCI